MHFILGYFVAIKLSQDLVSWSLLKIFMFWFVLTLGCYWQLIIYVKNWNQPVLPILLNQFQSF